MHWQVIELADFGDGYPEYVMAALRKLASRQNVSALDAVLQSMTGQDGFRTERDSVFTAGMGQAFERVGHFTNSGDIYAPTPLDKSPGMLVNIVLVFGPGHGKTMTLPDTSAHKDMPLVWMEESQPLANFYADGAGPDMLSVDLKLYRHLYYYHDEIDNDTEYCTIYVHDERCCDKVMP